MERLLRPETHLHFRPSVGSHGAPTFRTRPSAIAPAGKWPCSSGVPTEAPQGKVHRAPGLALGRRSGGRGTAPLVPLPRCWRGCEREPPDFAAREQHHWGAFCGFTCLLSKHLLFKGRGLFTFCASPLPPFHPSTSLPPWTHPCCSFDFPPNPCPGPLPPLQPVVRLTLTCPASCPDRRLSPLP